jgi:tripartite-type tricarboxylate transporter receptor subunit TctC
MTYKADQLQPVSNMIRIPNIVSAHPSTGIKSIPDLIAYIKANPDKLTYASSGVGQSPHLTGAWFLQLTGLKMVHVPFRGAGPALQAAWPAISRSCSTTSIPRCRRPRTASSPRFA